MANGVWSAQDKIQPGVYINFRGTANNAAPAASRGIVTIPMALSWGPMGKMVSLKYGESTSEKLGLPLAKLGMVSAVFAGTSRTDPPKELLVYRLNSQDAAKATATVSEVTVTAKYAGARGNDIAVKITAGPAESAPCTVETLVDGRTVDTQKAANANALYDNEWVTFSKEDKVLDTTTLTPLKGGTNGTIEAGAYAQYLLDLEPYRFHVIGYPGKDDVVKASIAEFAVRMRQNGRDVQAVLAGYAKADDEAVISINNGVRLSDGAILEAGDLVCWLAGATAGAAAHQSLTYVEYPGAVDAYPRLASDAVDEALENGEIVFQEEFGKVRLVQDINTLKSFGASKSEAFSKNRTLRAMDDIASFARQTFAESFIGMQSNDQNGRNLLKTALVEHIMSLQAAGAVQNFTADDITVEQGAGKDSVLVNVAVETVDSMEKIYMTVAVN